MAVQVDAHAGPVEAGRHLFDMGGLAGAVIALNHDPPVVGETGDDGDRRIGIEMIRFVEVGNVFAALAEGRDLHVRIDAEDLAHGNFEVRRVERIGR